MKNRYTGDICCHELSPHCKELGNGIHVKVNILTLNGISMDDLLFTLCFYSYGTRRTVRVRKDQMLVRNGAYYALLNEKHFSEGWLACDVEILEPCVGWPHNLRPVTVKCITPIPIGGCAESFSYPCDCEYHDGKEYTNGYNITFEKVDELPEEESGGSGSYDDTELKKQIKEVENSLETHIEDTQIHITDEEREKWNQGVVTDEERDKWNQGTGSGGGEVSGVKGNAELEYRKGNVNITPENIGLGNVDNTADADKSVKYAVSATKASQDGNGNVIAETYATKTEVSNVESIANEAKGKADSAETSSDEALNIANEAKTVANIAKNAVATLDGLSNTTTAQETLAAQVVQIEENKQNVLKLERDIEESQGYTNKDFSIEDEKGNSIVEFSNGHIRTKNFDSSIARPKEGYTDKDFSIDDEEGNSIVEFSNGHIRTKNFDSSVIKQATQYPYKDCINAFVDMMNKFVYDYGMKNTLFVNASGMGTYRDEEPEGDRNTSCPKDFMRLAACATQTDIMKYWNIQDYSVEVGGSNARTITGTCVYSTSEIIQNAGYHIIGGKTGSWSKNGNLTNNITLVVKSKINDDWLVGTIMKADTSIDRDIPIRDLFDWLEAKRQDSSTPDPTLQCEYACAGVVPKNNPIGFRLYDFSVVEKNSETNCLPASMTKIMTGIVALHFCKGNEILTVEATDMRGGSGDEVFVGDEFSLWDALVVMHLSSSNTLATAVSRFVGNIILNNK